MSPRCILPYNRSENRERRSIGLGQSRAEIIAWVAGNVIPHEAALRARLRRMVVAGEEIDDIVQETYLNIARLKSVEHIRDGRGYMFTAARMVMLQRIRRSEEHTSELQSLMSISYAVSCL